MYCSHCGHKNTDEAKYCGGCGIVIAHTSVTPEITSADSVRVADEPPKFLVMSPWRLWILSFFTLNLYQLYWFYKNWHAIRRSEQTDIMPFWRAVFSVFYCYSLFRRILNNADSHGYQNSFSVGIVSTFYIFIMILSYAWSRLPLIDPVIDSIILLIILATSPLPLLWPQKAINYYTKEVFNVSPPTDYSPGEVTMIVIGALLTGVMLFGFFA